MEVRLALIAIGIGKRHFCDVLPELFNESSQPNMLYLNQKRLSLGLLRDLK